MLAKYLEEESCLTSLQNRNYSTNKHKIVINQCNRISCTLVTLVVKTFHAIENFLTIHLVT